MLAERQEQPGKRVKSNDGEETAGYDLSAWLAGQMVTNIRGHIQLQIDYSILLPRSSKRFVARDGQ